MFLIRELPLIKLIAKVKIVAIKMIMIIFPIGLFLLALNQLRYFLHKIKLLF